MLKIVNVNLKQIAIQIQWTSMDEGTSTSIFFPQLHKNLWKSERFGRLLSRQKILTSLFGASSLGILVRTQDSNYINGGGFRASVSKLWRLKVRVLGKLGLGISAPSLIWRQIGPHTVCAVANWAPCAENWAAANTAPGTANLALANRARRIGHTRTKYQYQITKYLKHGFISSWRN